MMKEQPKLVAGDYLSISIAVAKAVGTLIYTVLTGWSRGDDCPRDYKRHVIYSIMRAAFPSLSVRQFQTLSPNTSDGYNSFAKKKGFAPEIVDLDDGAYGCFLGRKSAKKTLVWFHGGGYTSPASDQHWAMLWEFIELARKNGQELRVMMLHYELAPHGYYPLQLKQAVAAIKFLLDQGLQPSQILIGGDSAGGNLAAALMSHLTHPHPGVPAITLSSKIGGALLMSPWASFTQMRGSWTSNLRKDALDPATVRIWSDSFMNKVETDNWNQPAEAPSEWWKGLKVDSVAITAGKDEVLRDDIRALAENMKVHDAQIVYLEAPGEAHDAIILDKMFGFKEELASDQFINKWLLERLK